MSKASRLAAVVFTAAPLLIASPTPARDCGFMLRTPYVESSASHRSYTRSSEQASQHGEEASSEQAAGLIRPRMDKSRLSASPKAEFQWLPAAIPGGIEGLLFDRFDPRTGQHTMFAGAVAPAPGAAQAG